MNHVYRLVRGHAHGQWVAVSETANGSGAGSKKSSSRRLAVAAAAASLFAAGAAQAGPTGGQVLSGSGSIAQTGKQTTVVQTSTTLSLNWQGFNVAADERVSFVQPSAAAIAVNRIADPKGSHILGRIDANGQVWLINPNGILFGRDAQINVGGLVASTLAISDDSLGADSRRFSGAGTGSIVNQGTITAGEGGYVALLGHNVVNQGSINAPLGTVALGAGSAVTLSFAGSRLLNLQVDANLIDSLADNGGLIRADGGQVLMSAGARDSLLASVVNNTGVIQAQTVEQQAGRIVLLGGMAAGTAQVAGSLDASAPNGGAGGFVETSAAKVTVADAARVSTAAARGRAGVWLIDPVDFTIAASGGDISGSTLSANLAGGDVTILSSGGASGTAGDVNVNAAVAWSVNKLTLNAQNNINLNAPLTGTGTASLALAYGQGAVAAGNSSDYLVNAAVTLPAGANFSTVLGSDGVVKNYTVITTVGTAAGTSTATDLQGMGGANSANYALGADIDASATSGWNAGAGFTPTSYGYSGTFAGLGHVIDALTIIRSSTANVGLFGGTSGATLRDLTLSGGSVSGGSYTGALVGNASSGTQVSNVASSVPVSGGNFVGGLIGYFQTTTSLITKSHSSGNVTAAQNAGGLVGYLNNASLTKVYATGNVAASSGQAGGLVGYLTGSAGLVSLAYATGAVSGTTTLGGLLGYFNAGTVSDSYATGNVLGSSSYVGGLIGRTALSGSRTVSRSYATGAASGTAVVGGFAGNFIGTASNGFWNSSNALALGAGSNANLTGLTTAQLKQAANFSGFNFTTTWANYDGYSTPLLRSFLTPLTVTASSASKSYDGLGFNSAVSYSLTPNASLFGTPSYSCSPVCSTNAGSYTVTPGGLYSTSQQGYLISYANGTQTISKAPLTVTANDQSRVYGQTNPTLTVAVSGFVNGETAGTAAGYSGSGSGTTTATALTGAGTAVITASAGSLTASNYDFTNLVTGSLIISKAPLTVTANTAGKTYDGLAFSGGNGVSYSGFVNSESSTVLGGTLGYVGSSQGAINAGSYAITPQGLSSSNYQIAYADGALTVAKAALTVTADNKTRTYGQANPALTTTVSGFVNGENAATALGFGGSGSATSTATALTGAGTAAISASAGTLSASNYDFTNLANGTLTIVKAALTVTANAAGKTYDGLAFSGGNGVSYSGFFNSESSTVLGGTLAYAGSSQGAVNAGSYTITPQGLSSGNYQIGYADGALTVTKAALTVAADNKTRTYGQANPVFTTTVSGFVNGESAATALGFSGAGSATSSATALTGAGTAAISASAGTLSASNYDFTNLANGTLTIAKAALTVTANAASKTYDGLAFAGGNGVSYSGFVNGESNTALGGTLGFAGSSQGAVNAGSYTITPLGLASSNYQIGYADGALTVGKAALTVTADNKIRTYGQSNPGFTTTVSGFVHGESASTAAGYGGAGNASSAATALTAAGTAAITASAGSLAASNYDFSQLVNGTLTIAKAPLTVTANAAGKTYDGLAFNGGNGVVYSGFVNGESSTALGGTLAYTGGSQGAVNAGSYAISPLGLASSNYQLSYADGALTVAKAALTVTADNKTRIYGQANPGFTTTVSGFVHGESTSTAAGYGGTGNASSTATALTGAGTAAITASAGSLTARNYEFSTVVGGTLTVTKAALSVAANPASKTYDGLAFNGGNGVAYSGFVNGENSAALSGTLSFAGTSQGAINAGSYAITPLGLSSANYQLSYADGALTVAKAALTVTADNKTKIYGQANPVFTTTVSGFVHGESAATALGYSGAGSASSTATALTGAGTAAISAGAGSLSASNYAFSTFTNGSLTIAKAALMVTANAASKTYDGLAFVDGNGVAYSGLVNGDNGSALGGSLAYTGSSQGAVNAGSYTITPTGLASSNYQISYADGGLTVGKALLSLSAVSASNKVYDGNTAASITVGPLAGLVGGQTLNLSTAAAFDTPNAGTAKSVNLSYALADGSAGGLVSNYRLDEASFPARLTASITPASLRYVAAPAASFSGALPAGLTGQVSGWVAGESQATAALGSLVWTTPADTTSPPGRYAINGGGLSAANYLFAQDPGNANALTVQPGTVPEAVRAALAPGAGTTPNEALLPLPFSAAPTAAVPSNTVVVATAVRIGGPNGPLLQRQGLAVRLPVSLIEGTEE